MDEFFGAKNVIDASRADIRADIDEAIEPLMKMASRPDTRHVDVASLDPKLIERAFKAFSKPLLAWTKTVGEGTWLERPEIGVIESTIETEVSSTTLLLGLPGSGKSALLSKLGGDQQELGRCVLGIKADMLHYAVDTDAKLAERIGLPATVVSCVERIAMDKKIVVLVDQLDSLGDLSDLHSGRLDALLGIIHSLSGTQNVHVVASCRAFEHRHDTHLSTIEAEQITLEIPEWDEILPALTERGLDASTWPEAFRDLLRTPQHLKVFLDRVRGVTEPTIYGSYQEMLDEHWNDRVAGAEDGVARSRLLFKLAGLMADIESHWIPVAQLDEEGDVVKGLVSDGILAYNAGRTCVGFQHQTRFEHARARAFAAGTISLADYVIERQGGLFVRPTIWSTLHYLREAQPAQYEKELNDLVDADLRLHVRYLLLDFLGQVDSPTHLEQALLQPWLDRDEDRWRAISAISGNEGWFRVLKDSHLPALMKFPAEQCWPISFLLRSSWRFARDECLDLLRRHWLTDSRRGMSRLLLKLEMASLVIRLLQFHESFNLHGSVPLSEP